MLNLIANNDQTLVKEFIAAYGDTVWSMAKRSTRSQQEAEHATTAIFMDIWRCAAKFESSGLDEEVFVLAVARCRLRQLDGKAVNESKQPNFFTENVLSATL